MQHIETSGTAVENKSTFNISLSQAYDILQEVQKEGILKPGEEIILICVYNILTAVGVAGNGLVFLLVTLRKELRTRGNLYLLNLAASDLTLCLACMPFTLLHIIHRNWTLGELLCKLVPSIQGTTIMVSTGTIAVIAIDRHQAIYSCFHRGKTRKKWQIPIVLLSVWFTSAAAAFPIFHYQALEEVKFGSFVLYRACVEDWPSQDYKFTYTVFILVVQYLIPISVLIYVHLRISRYLNQQPASQQAARGNKVRRNQRIIVILSAIAVVFGVAWLPLHMFTILSDFYPNLMNSHDLYLTFAVCHIIAMISACINPIIYGWLNTNFRREFFIVCRIIKNHVVFCGGRGDSEPTLAILAKDSTHILLNTPATITVTCTSHV